MAPIAGWVDQVLNAGVFVAVSSDGLSVNVLLASWAEDWWIVCVAAVVALVVFSLLCASRIEAG